MLVSVCSLTLSSASPMAAWWGDIGPVLAVQNKSTGLLMYSRCNESETPVFAPETWRAFDTHFPTQNDTALAAVSLIDGAGNASQIALFYQDTDGSIIQGIYFCDLTSGIYHLTANQIIDAPGMPALDAQTRLAVVQPSNGAGLQLAYHADNNTLVGLASAEDAVGWQYAGAVSQDPTLARGSITATRGAGGADAWLATARNDSNIELALLGSDELTWSICQFGDVPLPWPSLAAY
jgi:hypothetical protein